MSPNLPDRHDRLGALGAAAAIAILLVGVPTALWRAGGAPWQVPVPGSDAISFSLRTGHVPADAWIEALFVVSWLAWLVVATAIVVEAAALARHGVASRLPAIGGVQAMVRPLLVRAALLVSLFASTPRPAAAIPLADLHPMTESIDAAQLVTAGGIQHAPPAGGIAVGAADGGHLDPVAAPATRGDQPTITTGRRDTLRKLAAEHLGDAERWPEIRALNAGREMPDGTLLDGATTQLRAGWPLLLPADAVVGATADTTGASVVEVESGDHLWGLAEERVEDALGREATDAEIAPYWAEVVEKNRADLRPPHDPDLIFPGQEIVLPSPDAAPASVETTIDEPSVEEQLADALAHEFEFIDTSSAEPDAAAEQDTPAESDTVAKQDTVAEQDATAETVSSEDTVPVAKYVPPVETAPPAEEVVPETEAEADEAAEDDAIVTTSWATRAGAGMLAAGLAAAVVRARTRREASRRLGEGDPEVDDRLLAVEGALGRHADASELVRAARAVERAVDHLPPIDEPFPQPRLVLADGVDLVVHRTDGSTVSFEESTLDTADVLGHLHDRTLDGAQLAPTLVPLGAGIHLDLETVGVLGLAGDERSSESLARAIVHHLTLGPNRHDVDVRCSAATARSLLGGRDADNDALIDEIARWSERITLRLEAAGAHSARRLRLGAAERSPLPPSEANALTPLIVVVDESERSRFASVFDLAVAARLPLAVVVVHAELVPVETQVELDSELRACLHPEQTEFVPAGLPLEVAEEFAELVNRIDSAPLRFRPPLDDQLAIDLMRAQDEVATLAPPSGTEARPATLSGVLGATRHGIDPLVEVAVLGPVEIHGASAPVGDDERSALCLLVVHGPQRPDDIDAALWPSRLPDPERVGALIDRLEDALGDGHLERGADGRIAIRAVSCDLVRARSAAADAVELDGAPRAAAWRQALAEIRGPAFDGASWPWLAEHAYGTRVRATRLLVDAALTLADEAQADGRLDELRLDLRRARRLAPWHEQLSAIALGTEGPTETDHGPSSPPEPPEEWQRAG